MVASASRRIVLNRRSLLALAALVVAAALVGIGPARAATEETEVPQAASASLAVGEFPGQIGEIVQNVTDQLVPTRRYRGTQRFDTARLIGLDAFEDPHEVVIARGDLFPDALAGSYLAGQRNAPILLTSSHRLEPDTLEALQDLDPNMVTLVGGTEAIGFGVASELGRLGFPTNRLGGADRFDTAAQVATIGNAVVGERDEHGRTAIVARADEFADALVAGSLSFTANYPLLLTRGDELHPQTAATLEELAIDHVIVPGGQAAVSSPVIQEMEADGIDVERVAGVDRVATSVEFARFMREELGFGLERVNTAIGTRFPDALSLGALSGSRGQPIVLTANETTLGGDGAVQDFLAETCSIDLAGIAGGHSAVTPQLEQELRTTATSTGAPCQIDLAPTLAARDLGTDHTLTGTVADNGGSPVANEDVRIEVYRATDLQLPADLSLDQLDLSGLDDLDTGLPLDELLAQLDGAVSELDLDADFGADPTETFVETTDGNGEVTATYTGPEMLALDVAVACLDDESESCALLSGGDVTPDTNLLTASAITLWAVDLDLPNLLLLDPPFTAATSGTDHEVTATALSADPNAIGDLGGLTDVTDPTSLLTQLLDPEALTDVGDLGLGSIGDLAGSVPDGIGTPVTDTPVRFEVYRATDLIDDLLGDLTELEGLADGNIDDLTDLQSLSDQADVASLLEEIDVEALLTELLGELTAGDVLGAVEPAAEGEEITDGNGQATFDYTGPEPALAGLDVVVACFPGESGDDCTTIVNGDLELPDQPGVGLAAATWLPAVLDGFEPLVSLGSSDGLAGLTSAEAGDGGEPVGTASSHETHRLDASALRLDGQPAADAPIRWDVYRTQQGALVETILGDLVDQIDLNALVDDITASILAGVDDAELVDQALLEDAVGDAVLDAVEEGSLEDALTSELEGALATELGALDLEGLIVSLAEEGALDTLLDNILGLLSAEATNQDVTAQQDTLDAGAQELVSVLLNSDEVQGAIDAALTDAVASLDLADHVDETALLDGIDAADVLDTAAIEDLADDAAGQVPDAVVDVLDSLGVSQLVDAFDPAELVGSVAQHVDGGTTRAAEDGTAQIDYAGPDAAGIDVVVACVGDEQSDCGLLGDGGLALGGPGMSIPQVASRLWAGPDQVEGAIGDLQGLVDQVTNELLATDLADLDVLSMVDVNDLAQLDDVLSQLDGIDPDTLAETLAEQELIELLQGDLNLIDDSGNLIEDTLEGILDDGGLLGDDGLINLES